MTSPIDKNSTPLSSIFAPYLTGAKAAATGLYENGNDLANIYAPLSAGSAAAATGVKKNNADLNTIFAAINTTNYPLAFNGQTYTRSRGRGTGSITLTMSSNGTWSIVTDAAVTLASGNWFNFGGAVSDYTVKFVMTGFANGPDPSGGSDTYTNGAPSPTALSSSPSAQSTAGATVINTNAANNGTVQVLLYKSGVLVSNSTCTFDVSAAG